MASSRSRWLSSLLVIALLAVAGGAWWHFRDYFQPPPAQRLPLDGCDLQKQACRRALPGGGTLEFSITPRPIPLVAPLKLRVRLEGVEARRVEVDFAGLNMNMGYNRPRLKRAGAGVFEGEGYLPVCIRRHMEWEAQVLLYLRHRVLAVPFRFDTYKN